MGKTAHAASPRRRQGGRRPEANESDLKTLLTTLAAAAALAAASGATAGPLLRVGVADEWPAYHPCGDTWWASATDIGFRELRLTVQWDGTPVIPNEGGLQTAVDCATLAGVEPVLAIYPQRPTMIGGNTVAQRQFAQFVALVGQTFPQVRDFVVGNEPNVNRFWQPQFRKGLDAAATDYEHTLARSYDALKLVRPDASVWGPAISSRGNDSPHAASNPSHSPVMFIEEMGAAYRASHRTRPIFDQFDMHPYPRVQDTDSYEMPFLWPQAGAANLDRIKQALWDAFHGTAQPVPAEQPARGSRAGTLPIDLDEVGSQTTIADADASAYTDGPESIVPVTPGQQAAFYRELVNIAGCDPDVRSLLFFPLVDDPDLAHGFQSGELYANLAHKQSYDVLKQTLADSAGGPCLTGSTVAWRHATAVVGAKATFAIRAGAGGHRVWRFRVTASEAVAYRAGVVEVTRTRVPTSDAVERALASARSTYALADASSGSIRAYSRPSLSFDPRALPPGTYVWGVTLAAAANPSRTSTFVSRSFRVTGRPGAAAPPARSYAGRL